MRFYKRLYKIGRKAKDEKMSQEQRYKLRPQLSKPLTAEFKQWFDEHYSTVPPKTSLGKAFVIARKNFLFCSSVKGAEALCLHFSLIRTAKRHGLDPYRYYVEILKAILHCQTVEDYEALLPWNIALPKVGAMKEAA